MLGTFGIEIALMVFVLARYWRTVLGRLAALLIFFLAVFQAVEYGICEAGGGRDWATVGYIAITVLPALGIDISRRLTHRTGWWAAMAYATALGWIILFAVHPGMVGQVACTGNYTILAIDPHFAEGYGLFYFLWLFVGMGMCFFERRQGSTPRNAAAGWMAAAYLAITLPTFIVNVVVPDTFHGIPSIMCGFALSMALILTLRVVPLAARADSK